MYIYLYLYRTTFSDGELKQMEESLVNIAGKILRGQFAWPLRMNAVSLCLHICKHLTESTHCQEVMVQLAELVAQSIRTTIATTTNAWSHRDCFGCRDTEGYSHEIKVYAMHALLLS